MIQEQRWGDKPYHSLDFELRRRFGEKVYKVSLDAGMTCPNRDGTLGDRGCIFCSAGGSGEFAADRSMSVREQIDSQIRLLRKKRPVKSFIAYFQAYTNTYAPAAYLRRIYEEAASCPDIAALSVATRPDCLGEEVISLLGEMNRIKPVWVELGLQTMHDATARYIRRGYALPCFEEAVGKLRAEGLEVIVHTILGLPGETEEMMLSTIRYLNGRDIQGVKLQLLHVLSGTDLSEDYRAGRFEVLSEEAYVSLVIRCIENLRPDITVHRLTGDGAKELLVAPLWASRKRSVLNHIHHEMRVRGAFQGRSL